MSWEPHFHMIGNRYTEFGMDNLIKLIGLPMNILISAWVLEVLGVKIKIFEKITIFLESLNWISLVSFNAYFGVCSSIQVFFMS